ncbi:hypothetical protein PI124_g1221 [Phytophthora idaei]|nr:hypothetical protein PI125_g1993 [Phytophthora idaei]KAG3133839.1 hypothetical protein PI126_g18981 [Phytophthora idaei]KAG3254225.1 hypothetical protein PI124_g1221 [Phytophthora idaei]
MHTHPAFYVGLPRSYQDPSKVSVETLVPGRQVAVGRQRVAESQVAERTAEDAATIQAERAAERLDASRLLPRRASLGEAERLATPSPQLDYEPHAGTRPSLPAAAFHRDRPPGSERRRSRRGRKRRLSEDAVPVGPSRCDSRREYPAEARPPPALFDERGDLYYPVGRLVARRSRQCPTQYLVKWRSYHHSQSSWEFEVPLREDCVGVVDAYDVAHPLPTHNQGLRRRRQAPSASCQWFWATTGR